MISMFKFKGCCVVAALIFTAVFVRSTRAQSIVISKKPDKSYSIDVTAPSNNPHNLQTTENFKLWVDVREDIQGTYSYPLNTNGVTERYFRLKPSTGPADPITVLVIGDSMPSLCCGWGRGLGRYFKDNVTYVNYGTAWYSTRVFLQSAEWDKMLLLQPNYVLINFGWIDGGIDPDRNTTLEQFRENLMIIINTIKEWGGVPIITTLHAPRRFDAHGKVEQVRQWHSEVAIDVAQDLGLPWVDLYKLTLDLFNELGPDGVGFFLYNPNDPSDLMHFSELGAIWVSQLLVKELPPVFGPYLKNVFEPPPQP